jgi:hypothetical protein
MQDIFTYFPQFKEELKKAFKDIKEKCITKNKLTTIQ